MSVMQKTSLTPGALFAAALSLIIPAAAPALDFPESIEPIRLRNALWQTLPDTVCATYVGLDQRTWYQLRHPSMPEDQNQVRRIIEREFKKEAPQLFGVHPVLFEPDGRVWFLTQSQRTILGYDGKEWTEHQAPPEQYFVGNCPGHGRNYRHGYNVLLAGWRFFPDSHGVHCFDGREWSYQRFMEGPRNSAAYPSLLVEPDRLGLIAHVPGKKLTVWRWRNNQWQRFQWDLEFQGRIAPSARDGIWLFPDNGGARFVSFLQDQIGASFAQLLAQLHVAMDAEARRRVVDAMILCGIPIRPLIETALAKEYDPDILASLTDVLEALIQAPARVAFGPYELDGATLLHCDELSGSFYLSARGVRDEKGALGPGMLIVAEPKKPRFIPMKQAPQNWHTHYSEDSGPLLEPGGKAIWISSGFSDQTPQLFDLEDGVVIRNLPASKFGWLHAVKADGTLFVGTREPTQSATVGVYRPGAPDDRHLIEAQTIEIAEGNSGNFGVGPDGSIWVCVQGQGLMRFTGERWESVAVGEKARSLTFMPSAFGDALLAVGNGKCFALGVAGATPYDSVEAFLQSYRKRPAGTSIVPVRLVGEMNWEWVAPDKAGNLWLLQSRVLRVLIGDRWIDAKPALLEAGSRLGEVEYLAAIADGDMVYVTDFMQHHNQGRSFFGKVVGGKIMFAQAPHTTERQWMQLSVRDSEGGFWIPGSISGAGGTCDWISGQLAIRVARTGEMQHVQDSGWATLCDQAGNVWLGGIRGCNPGDFNIWRNGAVAHRVTIPSASERTALFSDSPRSVFAWTDTGLYHLTCDDVADPANFKQEVVYTPVGIRGNMIRTAFSSLGFLAVSTYSDDKGRKYYLHVLPLSAARHPAAGEVHR